MNTYYRTLVNAIEANLKSDKSRNIPLLKNLLAQAAKNLKPEPWADVQKEIERIITLDLIRKNPEAYHVLDLVSPAVARITGLELVREKLQENNLPAANLLFWDLKLDCGGTKEFKALPSRIKRAGRYLTGKNDYNGLFELILYAEKHGLNYPDQEAAAMIMDSLLKNLTSWQITNTSQLSINRIIKISAHLQKLDPETFQKKVIAINKKTSLIKTKHDRYIIYVYLLKQAGIKSNEIDPRQNKFIKEAILDSCGDKTMLSWFLPSLITEKARRDFVFAWYKEHVIKLFFESQGYGGQEKIIKEIDQAENICSGTRNLLIRELEKNTKEIKKEMLSQFGEYIFDKTPNTTHFFKKAEQLGISFKDHEINKMVKWLINADNISYPAKQDQLFQREKVMLFLRDLPFNYNLKEEMAEICILKLLFSNQSDAPKTKKLLSKTISQLTQNLYTAKKNMYLETLRPNEP